MGAAFNSQSREKEGHTLDFTASLCCAVAVSLLQWKCWLLADHCSRALCLFGVLYVSKEMWSSWMDSRRGKWE